MRNDFRNDGKQSMAGYTRVADQGAAEANYDGQGALIKGDKKSEEDGFVSKLLSFFYDWAALYGGPAEARILAELLEDEGFSDMAHQMKEGLRDREKTGAGVLCNGTYQGYDHQIKGYTPKMVIVDEFIYSDPFYGKREE